MIFVSLENWDEIWRRNQFLCREFTCRYPGRRILFVAPARDISHHVRRGTLHKLAGPLIERVADYPSITVMRPVKLLPASVSICAKFNEWLTRIQIRRTAQQLGIQSPILWLNAHAAVHMAGRLGERSVIYDITDDWTQLTQSRKAREATVAQDARLCRKADAVIVCSQRLFELKQRLARNLHLVPNGVDAEHYAVAAGTAGVDSTEAGTWEKPVFGYTGSLHADRLDINLIEALSRTLTRGTIVFVGPLMLAPADLQRFSSLHNVVLTGAVPHERLPALMQKFDVCINPHKVTSFTESLNPLKLWEYLATGKPIVSTPVAGFRDYPDLIYFGKDAASFSSALSEALAEPAATGEMRRKEAQRHSWSSRMDAITAIIDGGSAPAEAAQRTSPERPPSVCVIIISYNTREMTLECLQTLKAGLEGLDATICVVDNASTDGSVAAIRGTFSDVKVIANSRNRGFGAANNRAMTDSSADYFLLLNSDAFPAADAIPKLIDYLRKNLEVAAVGPRLVNRDGSLQISCYRFPSPVRAWVENLWISAALPHHPVFGDYRQWAHDTERDVDFVVGACMAVRRAAYQEIGGFDPRFFMYTEEADWQRRMHDAGWKVRFIPTATVTHYGGASGAGAPVTAKKQLFDSLDYYERKHHGLAGLISLRCAMALGCFLRAVLWTANSIRPAKRSMALSRARLHSWLCLRQLLHWT